MTDTGQHVVVIGSAGDFYFARATASFYADARCYTFVARHYAVQFISDELGYRGGWRPCSLQKGYDALISRAPVVVWSDAR